MKNNQIIPIHWRCTAVILAVMILTIVSGCAGKDSDRIDSGVAYVKRELERTRKDFMCAVSFSSIVEGGGNPVTYIASSASADLRLPSLIWQGPPAPNSIVIRAGSGEGEYIIEGYTESADKPAVTEVVRGLKSNQNKGQTLKREMNKSLTGCCT